MLTQLNPNYWKAQYLAGHYYYNHKQYAKAQIHFKLASKKEITTLPNAKKVDKYIKKLNRKLQ